MRIYSLAELCHDFHQKNLQRGWWKKDENGVTIPRNIGELIALKHSELDECWFGWKEEIEDDHLPQFDMWKVELADTCIRLFDTLGYLEMDQESFNEIERNTNFAALTKTTIDVALLDLHLYLTHALEHFRKNRQLEGRRSLATCLLALLHWVEDEFDIYEIIFAKDAYNAVRVDHTLAHRATAGGKAF